MMDQEQACMQGPRKGSSHQHKPQSRITISRHGPVNYTTNTFTILNKMPKHVAM